MFMPSVKTQVECAVWSCPIATRGDQRNRNQRM